MGNAVTACEIAPNCRPCHADGTLAVRLRSHATPQQAKKMGREKSPSTFYYCLGKTERRRVQTLWSGTIENVGTHYLLSVDCQGIQRVYTKGNQDVQLEKYLRTFVRVRYVYTTVMNPNLRCLQPPCHTVLETIAVIMHIEPLTDAEATRSQNPCTP